MARIVIVEDDEIVAEIAEEAFNRAGHMASSIQSGDAAVDEIMASEPDLLILDQNLPGQSGMEILRAVRASPLGTSMAIMMLTANTSKLLRLRAEAGGADDYLVKPFQSAELVARAELLLRGP